MKHLSIALMGLVLALAPALAPAQKPQDVLQVGTVVQGTLTTTIASGRAMPATTPVSYQVVSVSSNGEASVLERPRGITFVQGRELALMGFPQQVGWQLPERIEFRFSENGFATDSQVMESAKVLSAGVMQIGGLAVETVTVEIKGTMAIRPDHLPPGAPAFAYIKTAAYAPKLGLVVAWKYQGFRPGSKSDVYAERSFTATQIILPPAASPAAVPAPATPVATAAVDSAVTK